jgi:hypothetical protein
LQGATLIEPDRQISRIRLSDKTSRLAPKNGHQPPGQPCPKSAKAGLSDAGQGYEVAVFNRECVMACLVLLWPHHRSTAEVVCPFV